MSKKKVAVKGGAPIVRIRENSRLMETHETIVDLINGRHSGGSFMDVFSSGFFGLEFLRNLDSNLEDDIIYSDEDNDDEDDDDFCPDVCCGPKPLEPHPRIRQLTDEEADKHAKELIEEEERRKDRTERNKRKKLRKKEKKRLEKENAVKDILPEEENENSENSENQEEENPVTENNAEANKSPDSEDKTEAVSCEESSDSSSSANNDNNTEEDEEQKDFNNSYSFKLKEKLLPEETSDQKPAKAKKKKETKSAVVKESKEEPMTAEKPEVPKKKEKKREVNHEPSKEDGVDSAAEELARRSRELAGVGNQLAASGEFNEAVKYFTDAIKHNPKEFKLFGNRSLCYERMQQYENALRDADLALCMEPNWIKGLFRKGKALCGLKRYHEASLIYQEVLQLESSSVEATQELKRVQTLHLMEMGFTWGQSSEALKTHNTLEEAIDSLFKGRSQKSPRPRTQLVRESDAFVPRRANSQSPTPHSRNVVRPELTSIWVGSLGPNVSYATLHELFSRAGTIHSIKMLLEQRCAFVNYTRKEDCDRAIQSINGMVVEGAPLSVRYPRCYNDSYSHPSAYKKECFFWRTTGCTRADCTFKHDPNHKNIDRDKFTNRLGNFQA